MTATGPASTATATRAASTTASGRRWPASWPHARLGAGVTIETGYQLQVEDAALVAEHDVVVFADADTACAGALRAAPARAARGRRRSRPTPSRPEALLALAREHFGCRTEGFVLGIRGYEFDEFGETLSPGRAAQPGRRVGLRAPRAARRERGQDCRPHRTRR